jgi:hypothetical protein
MFSFRLRSGADPQWIQVRKCGAISFSLALRGSAIHCSPMVADMSKPHADPQMFATAVLFFCRIRHSSHVGTHVAFKIRSFDSVSSALPCMRICVSLQVGSCGYVGSILIRSFSYLYND